VRLLLREILQRDLRLAPRALAGLTAAAGRVPVGVAGLVVRVTALVVDDVRVRVLDLLLLLLLLLVLVVVVVADTMPSLESVLFLSRVNTMLS
jgi:hypothetical protein